MSGGVTVLCFINGRQPYLSSLDDPRSVRANIYVNPNVIQAVPGSKASYATLTQDAIGGIGYPYVRRFRKEFRRQNQAFFMLKSPPFVPPNTFPLLEDPETNTSNRHGFWTRPFRGEGAIMYASTLLEFQQRAIASSRACTSRSEPISTTQASSDQTVLGSSRALCASSSSQSQTHKDFRASTEDLEATYESRVLGLQEEVWDLRKRLAVTEKRLEEVERELEASAIEKACLVSAEREQELVHRDLLSAMDRLNIVVDSTGNLRDLGRRASAPIAPIARVAELPQALPSYDEAASGSGQRQMDAASPTARRSSSSQLTNPSNEDADVTPCTPFVLPGQMFGFFIRDELEHHDYMSPEEMQAVHDFLFTLEKDVDPESWRTTLAGNSLIGPSAAGSILNAMTMDIQSRSIVRRAQIGSTDTDI